MSAAQWWVVSGKRGSLNLPYRGVLLVQPDESAESVARAEGVKLVTRHASEAHALEAVESWANLAEGGAK